MKKVKSVKLIISICPDCGKRHKSEYDESTWFNQTKCPKCYKIYLIDKKGQLEKIISSSTRHYKDLTALVIDKKTGQPFWLDKKGKKVRHDSSDVRYDLRNDPHGWKATGKKVRETDKYGNRYSRG
jgi:hypothetical protein